MCMSLYNQDSQGDVRSFADLIKYDAMMNYGKMMHGGELPWSMIRIDKVWWIVISYYRLW